MIALALVALAGCSGDDGGPEEGWAIVKVDLEEDSAPLASICIGDECRTFDQADDVRRAEFSALVTQGATFEVTVVGQTDGASGGAPVGGCILVRDGSQFIAGCGSES